MSTMTGAGMRRMICEPAARPQAAFGWPFRLEGGRPARTRRASCPAPIPADGCRAGCPAEAGETPALQRGRPAGGQHASCDDGRMKRKRRWPRVLLVLALLAAGAVVALLYSTEWLVSLGGRVEGE